MNLAFPDLICDHMMDKALLNINCDKVSDRQELITSTTSLRDNFTTKIPTVNWDSMDFNSSNYDFEMEVCRAERESQKLGSTINGYIAPFGKTL